MTFDKEKLKDFLVENWDVTLDQIIEKFDIKEEDMKELEEFLENLEKKGWISKAYCSEHKTYEYDPGRMFWD